MAYTKKQLEAIEMLEKEAAVYKRKADELRAKRAKNPMMGFDEDKRSKQAIVALDAKYDDKLTEIERIKGAKDRMDECLRKANRLVQTAENIKRTWEFD